MPTLVKKYDEEGVFTCIAINGNTSSHGTVWPSLKRATFVAFNNYSTSFQCKTRTFSLNITVAYSGLYMFSETESDFTITVSHPIRIKGHLNVTVDREGYGTDCGMVIEGDTPRTNVTLYLPTDNVYLGQSVNVTCKKHAYTY